MADTALYAAYNAIYTKLQNATMAGSKVYPDIADDDAIDYDTVGIWVYIVYFWAGGGESNQRRVHDANLTIAVKCVSNDLFTAFTCASQVVALLNNNGTQDIIANGTYVTSPLNGGANWDIKTSTQEDVFHFTELIDKVAETVYSDGAYYRLIMEAT
jgi:hypothetical protein